MNKDATMFVRNHFPLLGNLATFSPLAAAGLKGSPLFRKIDAKFGLHTQGRTQLLRMTSGPETAG
jgi:hypothetical protein